MSENIPQRISQLVDRHGSLRAAARAISLDVGYLSRLKSGEKYNPSARVLKKLGIKKVVSIHYVTR
jgi:hypothetical protein